MNKLFSFSKFESDIEIYKDDFGYTIYVRPERAIPILPSLQFILDLSIKYASAKLFYLYSRYVRFREKVYFKKKIRGKYDNYRVVLLDPDTCLDFLGKLISEGYKVPKVVIAYLEHENKSMELSYESIP